MSELKDSGERSEFVTGALRDCQEGKGRYDLLPIIGIKRLAQLLEKGATKYGERNWERGIPLKRFLDSAGRHYFSVLAGMTDEDHAIQAAWNLLCYVQTQELIKEGKLPKELLD